MLFKEDAVESCLTLSHTQTQKLIAAHFASLPLNKKLCIEKRENENWRDIVQSKAILRVTEALCKVSKR